MAESTAVDDINFPVPDRVFGAAVPPLGHDLTRGKVNKQSGKHFIFNSALGAINPRFDTNDIGFQSRTDVINGHLGMGWGWQDPNHWRKWANVTPD